MTKSRVRSLRVSVAALTHNDLIASGISAIFPLRIPALFITGTNDEALPLDMSDSSPKYFAPGQYRREVFEGADHWMLQVSHTPHILELIVVCELRFL